MALSLETQKKIYKLGQQVPLLSDREVARRLNVSRDAAQKYRGPLPTEKDVEEGETLISPETHLSDARTIERLRHDNGRLRAMNRMLTRGGVIGVESIIDQFTEALRRERTTGFDFYPRHYPEPEFVRPVFDTDHEEIATLVLSDWHIGETVRPEETNGVNAFNSVIAANRLHTVIDKFKRILRGHQAMYKVSKIWVPVLGDLINGSIHPEFLLTNDLLDIPAAMLAGRLLVMAALELKALGLPVEFDCVVGNHPRLVPQMPSKRQAQLSLDWVVYKFLEEKFENDPQVTVRVHKGQFGIVEQFGHRFVLEHGYKSSVGVGMTDRIRKIFDSPIYREATGLQGSSIDCLIIGDKHRSESGQGYFVNGSLVGQGEYGVMLRLDPIKACQWFFGISRQRVKTFQYELEVTGLTDEGSSNPFGEYATRFLVDYGR